MRSRMRVSADSVIGPPSQRVEGAQAPGDQQVHGHDRDREQRVRGRQRQVPEARVVVDDVADELRVGRPGRA